MVQEDVQITFMQYIFIMLKNVELGPQGEFVIAIFLQLKKKVFICSAFHTLNKGGEKGISVNS